ncbi:MAG: AMP-binding protein [Vicinamibacterales bacterium]
MRNVPEQLAETVSRFPDRLAVSVRGPSGVSRMTYRELDAMAGQAAGRLHEAGIGAGDRCAILAENSARWCAVYLGILRLGAVAVPFDTNYSPAQVATLLRDSGARRLVTSEKLSEIAGAAVRDAEGVHVLPLADLTGPDAAEGARLAELGTEISPGQPAVILYTSGTTADPKGVVLTHANLLGEKDGAFAVVHVDEHDVVLGVLPLFHSLAQMANLLLPYSIGAHVVFLETLNTQELLRALDEEGVTTFACVPQFFYLIHSKVLEQVKKSGLLTRALFRLLLTVNRNLRRAGLNAGPLFFGKVHRTIGRRMRLLITGGSKFDPAVGHDLHDLGFTILQAYGLTETSGAATVMRPGEPIATVGQPIKGVEVRIAASAEGADDGEVLIRGPIVMQGYWNRPDATADVLRDGWLYTGDLGRLDERGCLTITGRSKEIIVLGNGKNIYPEEIEAYYRKSAVIKELCVLGVESAGAHSAERLHAVVVPDLDVLRERHVVNTQELVRFELEGISVNLPSHKRVLSFDVSMEPLPRTTTGKLKRREIHRLVRELEQKRAEAGPVDEVADASPVEPHVAMLIEAVREHVTGVTVRADSNCELDLGLDSMERVELLASLEQRFGVRVPEDVAQSAFTVADLAEAFRNVGHDSGQSGLNWGKLLLEGQATPELAAILRPRRVAAVVFFAIARLITLTVLRQKVTGLQRLPREGAFIVSPNHQSYLDPFLVWPVLPFDVFRRVFAVGAAEYFQSPFMKWVAAKLNVVPVDPDANLLPGMQAAAQGLRRGRVLMLFPEGERSIDGGVKKFKKGAAILACHLGVPIVPVSITGAHEIWPRNRPLNWGRVLSWRDRPVIQFGEPIRAREGEDEEALTERIRSDVERMWLAATPASPPPSR